MIIIISLYFLSAYCAITFLSDSQIGVKFASDGRHEYDSDLRMGGQDTLPWISFGVALHASCWSIDDFEKTVEKRYNCRSYASMNLVMRSSTRRNRP